jgi:hypothetical protein
VGAAAGCVGIVRPVGLRVGVCILHRIGRRVRSAVWSDVGRIGVSSRVGDGIDSSVTDIEWGAIGLRTTSGGDRTDNEKSQSRQKASHVRRRGPIKILHGLS